MNEPTDEPTKEPTDGRAAPRAGGGRASRRARQRTAAYFDLDKTILATSTTLALGTPMRRSGIISTASLARGVVAQLPYLLVGADEDHTARLMTHLARMSAGVERDRFQEVVREALATAIAPAVYAEALDLIEAHRRAGHDIVVVSASGAEMVEPIAELVGADRAVATRMEVDEQGRFTGRIAHSLLHGAKVDALTADAAAHDISLERSWAYSDSISDQPMLEAVGHPVAVNPDRELRRLAADSGWPVRDFTRPVDLRHPFQPPRPWATTGACHLPRPSGAVVALSVGIVIGVSALVGTAAYLALRPAGTR
ncbi:HAD family hydrolase [Actinomyces howellii]|uniref:ACT domain-containing protein n=1 Tax=Actinomyces howellii TaxID=52771 RepID=A0A448HIT2_9ACTO|nr:HAD-IB family hydrolase [Actinomyces howellii]VEG29162.1 ACT domain-containing protein [Actinomyces howellii]